MVMCNPGVMREEAEGTLDSRVDDPSVIRVYRDNEASAIDLTYISKHHASSCCWLPSVMAMTNNFYTFKTYYIFSRYIMYEYPYSVRDFVSDAMYI